MSIKTWSSGDKVYASDLNGNFTQVEADIGTQIAAKVKFGGTGADGALSVASGTTTLDAAGAKVLVKNYTSINIAAGAILAISNPHANGTLLILKSQGNVTIAGTIQLTGAGATAVTEGWGFLDETAHKGTSGGNGDASGNEGSAGGAGVIFSNKPFYLTPDTTRIYRKFLPLTIGSGGGNGGNGTSGKAGGPGGRGGGGLLIECAGALDFSGAIYIDGQDGTNGEGTSVGNISGGGGGGGGAAGMALIIYNSLTANTGTIYARGGKGGDGGQGWGSNPSVRGGGSGGGAGNYTGAGAVGKAGSGIAGDVGANGAGSSGGSGGHGNAAPCAGGVGGAKSASDTSLYLIVANTIFT